MNTYNWFGGVCSVHLAMGSAPVGESARASHEEQGRRGRGGRCSHWCEGTAQGVSATAVCDTGACCGTAGANGGD